MFTISSVLGVLYLLILSDCGIRAEQTNNKQAPGYLSKQKCEEYYAKYSWKLCTGGCGSGGGGGVDTPEGVYRHMAALGYIVNSKVEWGACCGSLISPTFVLTAAHCLIDEKLGPVKYVRVGVVKLHVNNGTNVPQDISVLKTFIHPEYKPPAVYNDIALIQLEEAPVFGFNVYPACLHAEPKLDKFLSSTGWGALKHNGAYPDHLQALSLREKSYDECTKIYSNNNNRRLSRGIDNATQICAGRKGVDSCDGDSGGPLQYRLEDYMIGFVIVGVTSFGLPCLVADTPGVYTRVLPYLGWIEDVVWGDNEKHSEEVVSDKDIEEDEVDFDDILPKTIQDFFKKFQINDYETLIPQFKKRRSSNKK